MVFRRRLRPDRRRAVPRVASRRLRRVVPQVALRRRLRPGRCREGRGPGRRAGSCRLPLRGRRTVSPGDSPLRRRRDRRPVQPGASLRLRRPVRPVGSRHRPLPVRLEGSRRRRPVRLEGSLRRPGGLGRRRVGSLLRRRLDRLPGDSLRPGRPVGLTRRHRRRIRGMGVRDLFRRRHRRPGQGLECTHRIHTVTLVTIITGARANGGVSSKTFSIDSAALLNRKAPGWRRGPFCVCSFAIQAEWARTRRPPRRLRARRSSSLMPPHTPASCPESRAQRRHSSTTEQRRQTALACSTWSNAGPEVPMGKNSSGSSSRQDATWRQSDMTATLLASRIYQIISMHLAVPNRVLAVLRRPAAREQASSLVNTFTNCRDVKGATEKKYGR